ncbi:MAG TPA: NADH-quinone oxidoreductase subunit L [Chthonomonadales bacterium]|nr:NADH-quinone oxidoreductase subunit L [Chthonomonadales bacterium]
MEPLPTQNLVWLITGLPLLGFLFHVFVGKRVGRAVVGYVACGVVLASFAVSVIVTLDMSGLPAEGRRAIASLLPGISEPAPWIEIGSLKASFGALVDPLSMLMCLIVTGVGGLIHVYALGYMAADRDHARFFSYFNLFIFFMLTLVLADNILLMFVGWEGVGLCSYLLISFWYEDMENSKAGNKAFIVNRVGDIGFALGVMAIFATFGTLVFHSPDGGGFLDMAARGVSEYGALTVGAATLIGLLLFVGACGKSAQFPLHVWLPDAMAGPTPVSALIHAATMVTAGVVLLARVSPVIVHSPVVMTVIAVVGVFTALYAATIALTQTDIKKVLAYSTISQLGYMFLGCGVGAFASGMFHVTTHAFFKALLFLGAGSVIHALSGEQDMRRMGGLRGRIRVTHGTMLVGWLAICGMFPLAGFWSKDEIIGYASGFGTAGPFLAALAMTTSLLTALYMSRLMWKTFWSSPRYGDASSADDGFGGGGAANALNLHDDHGGGHGGGHGGTHGVHESPPSMTVPLIVLAVFSAVAGLIGTPWAHLFKRYLEPSLAAYPAEHGIPVMAGLVVGAAIAAVGMGLAWALYAKRREQGAVLSDEQRQRILPWRAAANQWYVDAAFTRAFVVWGGAAATAVWRRLDDAIIDGLVNGLGTVTAALSERFRCAQTGLARLYAMTMLAGIVALLAGVVAWGLSR